MGDDKYDDKSIPEIVERTQGNILMMKMTMKYK